MATVAMPQGSSQVPLDSIPITPDGGEPETAEQQNGAAAQNNENEIVTVFHDPENFNVKHPLANTWTLWFTKPPTGKGDSWNDLLKEVVSFESVEEFWGVYNNITKTSDLPVKADYHLFKQGVRPEWEDPQNKHGGKWAYTTKDKKGVPIDDLWLHTVLAAIGETLEDDADDEVMGVVVNVRKGFFRIGLWTRTTGKPIAANASSSGKARSQEEGKQVLTRIGKRFKEALGLENPEQIDFTGHSDSASAGSTRARAKFVV